jgi:muramoyltetrapeptide carboxypeptidase
MTSLTLFSPSGVIAQAAPLQRAVRRLAELGFEVAVDADAKLRRQRFAGDDDARLAAIHRVAAAAPSIAMATRGGYGLTRLLDRIDWRRLAKSVERGTRWVGHSDFTVLQRGLLAHARAPSWAGPMACYDFGRAAEEHGEPRLPAIDEVTRDCFMEAMGGELEAVGFRTEAGFDGLDRRGVLWGGNLAMIVSLLATPHWPQLKGGILFVEEVNEHPYRVERMLLQLHQAGVLDRQKAVLIGHCSEWKPSPLDRGYGSKAMVEHLRACTRTPLLTGLPFGHVPTKLTLPVGARVRLLVDRRDVYLHW